MGARDDVAYGPDGLRSGAAGLTGVVDSSEQAMGALRCASLVPGVFGLTAAGAVYAAVRGVRTQGLEQEVGRAGDLSGRARTAGGLGESYANNGAAVLDVTPQNDQAARHLGNAGQDLEDAALLLRRTVPALQTLGQALLRVDAVVRYEGRVAAPTTSLFTGPAGSWLVQHRKSEPSVAFPMRAHELREHLRATVRDARRAPGRHRG